ncbi:MAG: HepT-like ribonuclease domain-containing protein [Phycisphaerales bacterium]
MPRDPAVNPNDDRVRLTHMLEWAHKAVRFCGGRTPADFDRNELLLPAVLRAIETVGEASTKVSEPTRARLPGIDWWAVRRMRNRIIHGYDTVDTAIVWATVELALPPLIAELERALAAWPSDPPPAP